MSAEAILPDAVIPTTRGAAKDGRALRSEEIGGHSGAIPTRHSRESGNPKSFARYPKYKDSGVAWLGELPAHWGVMKLKWIAHLRSGETIGPDQIDDSGEFPVFGGNGLRGYTAAYTHEGDYALVGRQGALCGNINYASGKFWASEHAVVATPGNGVCTRWLGELLRSMDLNQYSASAAQPGLSVDVISNLVVAAPPGDEQQAIAAFLDRETTKIDALIAEQEKLIALLKEKRQALISHAVTDGLDPNATMKDSGIEWLGQIPVHWGVLPVWLLFELGRGRVISHEDIAAHEGPFPVYSSQTENDGEMGSINTYDFEGDYLTWTTDGANAGTVFRRSGRFNCTNVCGTLKARSSAVDLGYMVCALGASTSAFVRLDINPKLMNNVMAGIRVPVPPESEQQAISALVTERTSGLDKLMQEAIRAIALLKERRTALISAAVTGKICVLDS